METSSYECPISTCGRRFEDAEKLQVHVSRRHPEYHQGEVSKKDNASDSNSQDNSSVAMNNTVNAAKTAAILSDDKKPPLFSGSILGRPPSSSKNKTTTTTTTTAGIKPCSPRVTPVGSDNLKRSQELFRRSAENLQLVAEKTRGKSLDNQQEASIEVQERKQQKQTELKEQWQKTEKDLKRQQSMQVDKELIESIMFELNRENDQGKQQQIGQEGIKSERTDIAGVDCQDEVMSEEEGEDEDEQKSRESSISSSQKLTKTLLVGSSNTNSRSAVSSLSSSLASEQSKSTTNNLPSVQGILSSRAKLTRQFILSKSGNSCEQLEEIENLIISNEELLVFEDAPPSSHSSSLLCELIHLRSLSLSSNLLINIVSLREFCLSLMEVNLNFNNLTDLSPLSECMLLERISASHNRVRSIATLAELPSLRVLLLFNNQLDHEDIRNLQGFRVLKELDLGQNPCASQQGLGAQYRLQVLSQCRSLSVLDQQLVTPSEIVQAGNYKQGQSHHNVKQSSNNRPSTAPMQRATSLSASVIVNSKNFNNIDKKPKPQVAKETAEQSRSNVIKDLENQLHQTQQNSAALREQIKQQKKLNKVTESELSELEKQNILFRDQASQVEGITNSNKILLRKISAYESTLVLHQETPEELKNYLKTLSNQVQKIEEDIAEKQRKQTEKKSKGAHRESQQQSNSQAEDDENMEYGAEQLNELLMRSTAAFSQIKKDLKLLHNHNNKH